MASSNNHPTTPLRRLQHFVGNDLVVLVHLWETCNCKDDGPEEEVLDEMELRSMRINRELKRYLKEVRDD